jgi:hypothetical protein
MIFIPTLIIVAILVNMYPCFGYNPNIILRNTEFNIAICTTIITGLLSLSFAKNPRWLYDLLCHNTKVSQRKPKQLLQKDGTSIDMLKENRKDVPVNPQSLVSVTVKNKMNDSNICHTSIQNVIQEGDSSEITISIDRFQPNLRSQICKCKNKLAGYWTSYKCTSLKNNSITRFSKKNFNKIIIPFVCIILVLCPVIFASLLVDLREDGKAYIYYTNLNETKIMQVHLITVKQQSLLYHVKKLSMSML